VKPSGQCILQAVNQQYSPVVTFTNVVVVGRNKGSSRATKEYIPPYEPIETIHLYHAILQRMTLLTIILPTLHKEASMPTIIIHRGMQSNHSQQYSNPSFAATLVRLSDQERPTINPMGYK
jgi:hypothetical protein